jgi:hypothetical protein
MEAERLNSRGEFERVKKETFVEAMLLQVADGLASDSRYGENSANRIRRRVEDIAEGLDDDADEYNTAGRAVLESRFALGHDDSQYLSQAVSLLWAGDGGERLRIVPPAIMPEIMRHASADGIVKAMATVMVKKKAENMGGAKDGLELAGWLMQMEEVRDAVTEFMLESQFKLVRDAASSLAAQYAISNQSGMDYVTNLISHSPDEEANALISNAVLEAVFLLSQEGSHPMRIVDRLLSATKGMVDRASIDSAIVFELATQFGELPPAMRIDEYNFIENNDSVCPMYDDTGARIRDVIATKPTVKQMMSTLEFAYYRIAAVSYSTPTGDDSNVASRAEVRGGVPPENKRWFLQRVVSPLWNQGSLLNTDSVFREVFDDKSDDIPNTDDAKDNVIRSTRNAVLNSPTSSISFPECRFDRLGHGDSNDSMFVTFCMLRGLCGYKGPHQQLAGYAGSDPLNYSYPTTKMTKRYRRGKYSLMEEVRLGAEHLANIMAFQNVVYDEDPDTVELDTDFYAHVDQDQGSQKNTDFANDEEDFESARPVMWAPVTREIGSDDEISFDITCKRVCEASVYEFMVTSLRKRSQATDASNGSLKRLLNAAAACAKLRQLHSMAHIKTTDVTKSKFLSIPSRLANTQFVTRPCQHCGSPDLPFDASRTLVPVDAGLAMFSRIEGTAQDDLVVSAPPGPGKDVNGYKRVQVEDSDGDLQMVYYEDVTHWLRAGVERGTEPHDDYSPMNRSFSLHIESDPENEPVDASTVTNKIAIVDKAVGSQWIVPMDLHIDAIGNVMASSIDAVSNLDRIKHEESYIANLSKENSKERQAVFGIQRSVEDATRDRRAAVWSDALREVAVSGDRLYRFVTTLTGAIGEAADSAVSWEDDDLKTLSKEAVTRQKALVDRVSRFQTKLVESVVSSTLKASKLQLDVRENSGKDGGLVVLSSDVKDSIRQITDGEAGHGFFEASVELNNVIGRASKPMSISEIVRSLQNVSTEYHDQIAAGMAPSAPASYQRVVEPRNSFMLHLKPDTSAAIQKAFDYITSEMRHCEGYHRHIHLWEFVEGSDWVLTTRFAELVGLMLQNTRMRSGNFAAYVGTSQLISNGHNIRMQIQRLKTQVCYYLASHMDSPMFLSKNGRTFYFGGSLKPNKRKIDGVSEQDRERRRKKRDAPFGGDDGDDRDDKPGLPKLFPRDSVKREILERMIQNARLRNNISRQNASDGGSSRTMGISFKDLANAIKNNKFVPDYGATVSQGLEASADYLLSTKPGRKEELVLLAAASLQHGLTGHVEESCNSMFQQPDGTIAPEDRICVTICDDLMKQGYKFDGGYLQTPKTRKYVRLPRLGRQFCYTVQIDTNKHMPGLTGEQHNDANRRDTFAIALNKLFGMNMNTHFASYNANYDWRPHPLWGLVTNTNDKYYNVWVKYIDSKDAYFRAGMTQVFKECRFLVVNHKLKSAAAMSIVTFGILQKAGMLDVAGLGGQAITAVFGALSRWVQALGKRLWDYGTTAEAAFKEAKKTYWDPTDPDAPTRLHPTEKATLFRLTSQYTSKMMLNKAAIDKIKADAESTGITESERLHIIELESENAVLQAKIDRYTEDFAADKLSEEAKVDTELFRTGNPNLRSIILTEAQKMNPETSTAIQSDLKKASLQTSSSAQALLAASFAQQLPDSSFTVFKKSLGPVLNIFEDGIAMGIPIEDVISVDDAAMEEKYRSLLLDVSTGAYTNVLYSGASFSSLTNAASDLAGRITGSNAQQKEAERQFYKKVINYFKIRKNARRSIDGAVKPEWSPYNSATWGITHNLAAQSLGRTTMAFLKLDRPSQEKLYEAALLPYHKMINSEDFQSVETLEEYVKKPEVQERLIGDLVAAFGVSSREDLERSIDGGPGVLNRFYEIIEKGGLDFLQSLTNLYIDAFTDTFIRGEYGPEYLMEMVEKRRVLMGSAQYINGKKVITTATAGFTERSMIERPRDSLTWQRYVSLGKYIVDNVENGKFSISSDSEYGYSWPGQQFQLAEGADAKYVSTFAGITKGVAAESVWSYLYADTAATLSVNEQRHMFMGSVLFDRIGVAGAVNKFVTEGGSSVSEEDICSSLLAMGTITGQVAHALCLKFRVATNKDGTPAFPPESILVQDGKVTFDLRALSGGVAQVKELGINLADIFEGIGAPTQQRRVQIMSDALSFITSSPGGIPWETSDGSYWRIATGDSTAEQWIAQRKANNALMRTNLLVMKATKNDAKYAAAQLALRFFGGTGLDEFSEQARIGFTEQTPITSAGVLAQLPPNVDLITPPTGNFAENKVFPVALDNPLFDSTNPATSLGAFVAETTPIPMQELEASLLFPKAKAVYESKEAPIPESSSGTSTAPSGPRPTPEPSSNPPPPPPGEYFKRPPTPEPKRSGGPPPAPPSGPSPTVPKPSPKPKPKAETPAPPGVPPAPSEGKPVPPPPSGPPPEPPSAPVPRPAPPPPSPAPPPPSGPPPDQPPAAPAQTPPSQPPPKPPPEESDFEVLEEGEEEYEERDEL